MRTIRLVDTTHTLKMPIGKGRRFVRSIRQIFFSLPTRYKLSLISGIFVSITVCILILSNTGLTILSNVRAYTTGEGLWSKGQKDAVYHLLRYAHNHDEAEYDAFLTAIAVPLGDHQARVELDKPEPDMAVVYEGFIQGGNHPEDVAGMANLFLRFRNQRHMSEAIDIWAEGDELVFELIDLAEAVRAEVVSGDPDEAQIAYLLEEIDRVSLALRPLEDRFSAVLGEGGRWMHRMLITITTAVAVFLLTIGCLLSWWLLHHVRVTQEKYRHLFETANDAIVLADAHTGALLDANQKAEELWGMPRQELLTMHQSELHPAEDRERYRVNFQRAAQGQPVENGNMFILRADGSTVPVVVSASLTELNGQRVLQGIFHDISERKQMEESLRQTQKLQSLGVMAGGLAHDFNNMLSTILMRNELALRQIKSGKPDVANLEKSLAVTQQAIDLTGKMLAYSGQGHFTLTPVDLNEVITARLSFLKSAVSDHASITLRLAPQLPSIELDLNQVNQLLLNLVTNSVEAIEEAGHQGAITLATARCQIDEAGTVITAAGYPLLPGCYVQLSVVDDGVGMDEETAAHIFDPFYSKRFVGRGLGLPVVLGIMRGHGGGVRVTSEPGQGATVDLYFPCVDDDLN
jgi:PAS domain S-box-containing protein